MSNISWCIVVASVLAVGCFSPGSETSNAWPVEEPAPDGTNQADPAMPPPEETAVILLGSPTDPNHGGVADFFADVPNEDQLEQCWAVEARLNITLRTEAGIDFVVLPKSLTHTPETYIMELRYPHEISYQSWVWGSDVGRVWGKRRGGLDVSFQILDGVALYYSPFLTPPLPTPYGQAAAPVGVSHCRPQNQEILTLPIEIEIEVRSGNQTRVVPMRAEISQVYGATVYSYEEVQ